MAIITGYTVTYTDYTVPTDPRLLNVPDAWGDVKIQDLWDTLSQEEALTTNLYYKKLISRPKSGGKNTLSTTKSVGITIVMNNIQIKFVDQPGPTWVRKKVVDGNIKAVNSVGTDMEPIANSNFTNFQNEADVSAAIVDNVAGVASAVWNALRANHVAAGSFGEGVPLNFAQLTPGTPVANTVGEAMRFAHERLDAAILTRAAPGDQMALINDAINAAKIANDAIGSLELSTDAVNEIRDAIMGKVVEVQGSYTVQQVLSIMLSALAGVTVGGGATLKTPDGVANRIAATVNASNERTAMTVTPSA